MRGEGQGESRCVILEIGGNGVASRPTAEAIHTVPPVRVDSDDFGVCGEIEPSVA
jgi:hypothetical protein